MWSNTVKRRLRAVNATMLALEGTMHLTISALAGLCLGRALWIGARARSSRRRASRTLGRSSAPARGARRVMPLLGFALTFSTSPERARAHATTPPGRELGVLPGRARSETGGFSPPPPLVLTGHRHRGGHPALHRTRRDPQGSLQPLFPRVGQRKAPEGRPRSILLHPSSGDRHDVADGYRGLFLYSSPPHADSGNRKPTRAEGKTRRPHACNPRFHVVAPEESLWSIAAVHLSTEDPADIAAYWPSIYRANRAVVGPDPARIFPGQRLRLPRECKE